MHAIRRKRTLTGLVRSWAVNVRFHLVQDRLLRGGEIATIDESCRDLGKTKAIISTIPVIGLNRSPPFAPFRPGARFSSMIDQGVSACAHQTQLDTLQREDSSK